MTQEKFSSTAEKINLIIIGKNLINGKAVAAIIFPYVTKTSTEGKVIVISTAGRNPAVLIKVVFINEGFLAMLELTTD